MSSFSLGLKKLIFSKRDPPVLETSHIGRERKRKAQNIGRRRGERDVSPFEEVEARSFEMTDAITDRVKDRDHRHRSGDSDEFGYREDLNDSETQEDASEFEEIVWQDNEKAYDALEPCIQDQGPNTVEKSKDVNDTSDGVTSENRQQMQLNDILTMNTQSSQTNSPLEEEKDVMFEEKIFRPQGSEMLSLSDSIQGELDDIERHSKAQRHEPITTEQFWGYFDSDGRIVDENQLKRTIFKGGVEEDIRKDVWSFLFELYPWNSTTREREALRMEHSIGYDALKARWRPLLKQIEKDPVSGVRFCPDWLRKRKVSTKKCDYGSNLGKELETGDDKMTDDMDVTSIRGNEKNFKRGELKGDTGILGKKTGDRAVCTSAKESRSRQTEEIGEDFGRLDVAVDRGRKDFAQIEYNQQPSELHENPEDHDNFEKNDIEDTASTHGDDLGLIVSVHGNIVENIRDAMMEAMMEEPLSELELEANVEEKLSDSIIEGEGLDRCINETEVCDIILLKGEKKSGSAMEKHCIDEEVGNCPSEEQFSNTSGKLGGEGTCILRDYKEKSEIEELNYGKVSVNEFFYVSEEETDSSPPNASNQECKTEEILLTEESFAVLQCSDGVKTEAEEIADYMSSGIKCRSAQVGDDGPRELENALHCDVNVVETEQLTSDENADKSGSFDVGMAGMQYVGSKTEDSEEPLNKGGVDGNTLDHVNKQALNSENESYCRRSIGSDSELETIREMGSVLSSQFQSAGDVLCKRHDIQSSAECQTSTDSVTVDLGSRIVEPDVTSAWTKSVPFSDCHELTDINDGCELMEEDSNLQESKLETDLSEEDLEVSAFEEELLALQEDAGLSLRADFRSGIVSSEDLLCAATWKQDESCGNACEVEDQGTGGDPVTDVGKARVENDVVNNGCTAFKSEDCMISNSKDVCVENRLALETLEFSPIKPCNATSESKGYSDKPEVKAPFSVSPWLQQQLDASSPAGTKTKRMIRIHEEGFSSIENIDAVVPLREIAEKASLAVQKQLIEQERVAPRSSTPVEEMLHRQPIKTKVSDEDNEMDSGSRTGPVNEESKRKEGFAVESNKISHEQCPSRELVNGTEIEEFESSHQLPLVQVSELGHRSQSQGQVIGQRTKVSHWTSGREDSIIDPETGENGDGRLKEMRGRERTSLSSNFDSNGESSLQRPLDHSRKAFSAANLNDNLSSGIANQGAFNLLKNLDESISKSDSNVYKVDQENPQLSRFSWFEPHDSETCLYCATRQGNDDAAQGDVNTDLKQYVEIQAKVHAGRQAYDVNVVCKALRIIDKDVPRTDRELEYFKGNENPNLLMLRDALITYAFFHPDVGYAQGMNDIMSRFFVVMESEADAYWMFCNYMDHFKGDFLESDMLRKISLVEQLLMKMDRELFDFFQNLQLELIFCHRWLLLSFKREFSYEDGLRIFEIVSSKHLEVSSVEAEMERSRERARELEKDEGSRMEEIYVSPEYSFDVFVCVAMLQECRDILMSTNDIASIYQILSNLPKVNDLDVILLKAEDLFFNYCRKSTMDCFQLIDEPIEKKTNWKQRFHLDF